MSTARPKRPTLIDVAREAGVSRSTASRVLAGSTTVAPAMQKSVTEAAERLGYQTNASARSLRSGLTGFVALVIPASEAEWLAGSFIGAPVRGATKVLAAASIQPVLLLEDGTVPSISRRYLAGSHVDAAIVFLQAEAEHAYRALADVPIPVVFVGHPTAGVEKYSFVDSDNYSGGRLAARALFEAGRTRVAVVGGPATYLPSNERLRGFADEAAEWGVPVGRAVHGSFATKDGADAMARILARQPDIDGLFALSDLLAVGAIRVLNASGRKVPEDVAVVGFDDTAFAATANPPLTSVRQPLEEMGEAAAHMALEARTAGVVTPPVHMVLPTTLTRRESV